MVVGFKTQKKRFSQLPEVFVSVYKNNFSKNINFTHCLMSVSMSSSVKTNSFHLFPFLFSRVTEEESTATTMEALKARIRELERQILRGDRYKCLICMVSITFMFSGSLHKKY